MAYKLIKQEGLNVACKVCTHSTCTVYNYLQAKNKNICRHKCPKHSESGIQADLYAIKYVPSKEERATK